MVKGDSTPVRESINADPALGKGLADEARIRDSNVRGHSLVEQHFATDHLRLGLKSRTISSAFVTITAQGAKLALTLISTVVLARMLAPEDFGLIAMVMTVMGFVRIFRDAGLSTATIQRETISHAQVSNLFWINVALSGLMSLVVAVCAPAIAWFFREPRLVDITLILSISFLLTGLTVQHMALLNRQMRFRVIALIEIGSMLAGVVVGIGMALLNFDYWSLVGFQLTVPLAALLLTWWAFPWRPKLPARRSGTRSFLKFGANLTASGLIYSLSGGADSLLIGRFFGVDPVGLYSRAGALLRRPLEQLLSPITAVFIPVLSMLQDQPTRYRRAFLRVYEAIALTGSLGCGLCLALARPLTLVALGPQWEGAIAIFGGFAIAALFTPLAFTCSWLLESQGRGKDILVTSVIISGITIISFGAGLPFGAAGVAISYSIFGILVQLPFYFYLVGRSGPVGAASLWLGFLRHLPVWGVAFGAAFLTLTLVVDRPPWLQLLICLPAGFLVSISFIGVYAPSRRTALSLLEAVREFSTNRRTANHIIDRRVCSPGESASPGGGISTPDNRVRSDLLGAYAPGAEMQATGGFSVIIPSFNRSRWVQRAIESALGQTLPASQIIVVDDGSTDDTAEVCRRYGNAIEYFSQPNSGVSIARNNGIRLARYPWTAFLDSDDYWTPIHLEKIAAAIKATEGKAHFYFTDMLLPGGGGARYTVWKNIGFKFSDPYFLKHDVTDWVLADLEPCRIQCTVFDTVLLKNSGGFDSRFRVTEDRELFCRLGIGAAACAVNTVGCIQTADDFADKRLGGIVHTHTISYWEHECLLWNEVLGRFPSLSRKSKRAIKNSLTLAHWRLCRMHWNLRRVSRSLRHFVALARARPTFLWWLLRHRKSDGWETDIMSGPADLLS